MKTRQQVLEAIDHALREDSAVRTPAECVYDHLAALDLLRRDRSIDLSTLEGLAIGLEQRGEKSAAHLVRTTIIELSDDPWHDATKEKPAEDLPVMVWDGRVMAMARWVSLGDHGFWSAHGADGPECENAFEDVLKWRLPPSKPKG